MMISYELAKELKEKCFPQPEPKFSQVWYADYDNGHMLGRKLLVGTNEFLDVQRMEQSMVFCPTFEDIWEQLPNLLDWDKPNATYQTNKSLDGFRVAYEYSDDIFLWTNLSKTISITEAAAKLWLTLKEQGLI